MKRVSGFQHALSDEHEYKEMMSSLSSASGIHQFITEYNGSFISQSIGDFLKQRMLELNMTKAAAAQNAGMSEIYLYQILSGIRHPSRNRMICLGIGFSYSLGQIQDMLLITGYAQLRVSCRRDAIIMYGIVHKKSLRSINEDLLSENEISLLG